VRDLLRALVVNLAIWTAALVLVFCNLQ